MRYLISACSALLLLCLILASAPQTCTRLPASATLADPASPPLAVCFAPGTDPDYVAEWTRRITERADALDYNLGGRWSSTAHGATGTQGDGVTLTYSFVPDGVSIEGDPNILFATMNQQFGSPDVWQNHFAQVFAQWSAITGNTYEQVSDDGANWSQNSPGVIGARGDIRIASTQIDGGSNVLAYNFFPNRGDMVLDAAEDWNNPTQNYIFLHNVTAHEHGHGLGLEHVCPIEQTKLLEPFYSSSFVGPQHDEILAGQRNYGDPYEPNDEHTQAYDLGAITGSRVVQNTSIDDNTDADWWHFTVLPGRSLTITLEPDGYIYLEGEQNNDGSCEAGTTYNTRDDQDLNMTLYAGPDTTHLINIADNGIELTEQLFRYDVPNNVTDLKLFVWSGSNNNAIQLYRLTIESVDPATPYTLGCPMSIDTTLQGQPAVGAIVLVNPSLGNLLSVSSISVTGPFTVEPSGPIQLNPGAEQTLTVTFNALDLGTQSGTLTINHNGPGGPLTCEVSGTAIASGIVFFTTQTANFGEVPINSLDSVLVGLRSTGNVPLIIHSMTTSAPFTSNFDGPVSLQPGPLLRVYPHVFPTQLGETRGWLIINHSATSSPDSIELVVTGVPNLSSLNPVGLPAEYALYQNYPNPFNPATTIEFDLPEYAPVSLKLYNIQGQWVQTLIDNQSFVPGHHAVQLNGSGLSSGVYFYRLESTGFTADRKLLLLK